MEARLGDRSLFPDLEPVAYLNHAGVSPPSRPVVEAARQALEEFARRGSAAVGAVLERRTRLKDKLGRLLGAPPEELGLTQNTGAGLTAVALCFPWRPGDRIVGFRGEFPANVTPWQRAAELFGLELSLLPLDAFERGDEEGLAALEAELRRGARLVAVSAVQFQTGLRMPLQAMAGLAHRHGAEICVDAVQALGVLPLDVRALGIDYLAAGAQKWLMGPLGAGVLWARPERAAALRPHLAGWLSHERAAAFFTDGAGHLRYDRPVRRRADVVESGGAAEVSLAGLEAALDPLLALGLGAIRDHVDRYLDRLEPELLALGLSSARAREPDRRSGILSVRPPPGVQLAALARALWAQGVAVSTPDGWLRFSPHWPNHPDEVPTVAEALRAGLGR
ncbi:MAG TPA: aminotransferase class V-fold PLP-dependent enzyme [Anaeromyxobacteraceae bacterium]|nr:aminotransferase class V-fold PLP-dependent enzyme [Anaeromyxobacteraceae bacterium]